MTSDPNNIKLGLSEKKYEKNEIKKKENEYRSNFNQKDLNMIIKEYEITKESIINGIQSNFNKEYYYFLLLSHFGAGFTPINFNQIISDEKLIMNINIKENRGIPLNLFLNSKQCFDFTLFSSFVHLLAIFEKHQIIIADLDLSIFEVCEDNTIRIVDLSSAQYFNNKNDFKGAKAKLISNNNIFIPPEKLYKTKYKINPVFENSYFFGIACLLLLRAIKPNDEQEYTKINGDYKRTKPLYEKFLSNLREIEFPTSYSHDEKDLVINLLVQSLNFNPEKRPTFLEMETILDPRSKINPFKIKSYFNKKNRLLRSINYLINTCQSGFAETLGLTKIFDFLDEISSNKMYKKYESKGGFIFHNENKNDFVERTENLFKAYSDLHQKYNDILLDNELLKSQLQNYEKQVQLKKFEDASHLNNSIEKNFDKEYNQFSYMNVENPFSFNKHFEDFLKDVENNGLPNYFLKSIKTKYKFYNQIFLFYKTNDKELIELICKSSKWNLSKFDLSDIKKFEALLKIMAIDKTVIEFSVNYFDYMSSSYIGLTGGIGDAGLDLLKKSIEKSSQLISLNISAGPTRKNPVSSKSIELLNQVLECLVQLEDLDLSYNTIQEQGMALLRSGFKSMTKLKKLNLEGTLLANIGLMYLKEFVDDYNFTHLNLSRNNLSTFIVSSQDPKRNLCDMIRNSSRLIYINISFNELERKQLIDIILFLSSLANPFAFLESFVYKPNKCSVNEYQEIEFLIKEKDFISKII